MPFSIAVFDNVTINDLRIEEQRVPGTVKQVVGTELIKTPIPGRTVMDWELTISGMLPMLTREADRATLQADFVSKEVKAYTDGVHDGNYIIEELTFSDSGERPEIYDYQMKIVQFQQ